MQTLFHLKDKKLYPTCKIYYGVCECEENITSAKQKETQQQGGQNMIIPIKILSQQGT